MSILNLQRRQRELGRIRMGDKGGKGQPQKLSEFRLTSPAKHLLDEAAGLWGGEVRQWDGSPSEGQWELYTKTSVLPIVIPPGREPVTQWMEQWTGGGCTHRCDTERNHIDDTPCSCDPDNRACKATTRVNVMLPDLPDVGVWRLETHGINAAYELPGTIDLIQMASAAGQFLTGRLRIEHRTSKKAGQTRKFIVPVIDLDITTRALMAGEVQNGSALQSGAAVAGTAALEAGTAALADGDEGSGARNPPDSSPVITEGQKRRMFAIARDVDMETSTLRALILDLTGQESSAGIPARLYDSLIETVQAYEQPAEPEDADALFAPDRREDVA